MGNTIVSAFHLPIEIGRFPGGFPKDKEREQERKSGVA